MSEYILGIHYGHDSTAALMCDGVLVEAMSEERLSRQKKHRGFPHESIAYIKNKYTIETFTDVILVGDETYYDNTIFTTKKNNIDIRKKQIAAQDYMRSLGSYFPLLGILFSWRDKALAWKNNFDIQNKVKAFLHKEFPHAHITILDHHLAHAWASVFFFDTHKEKKKIILTLDGAGDGLSGSINIYDNGKITRKHEIKMENSIGLLYCAIVDILGMTRNEHEFKVMGLAPYAKASNGEKVYEHLKKLMYFDAQTMTIVSTIEAQQATAYLIAHDFHQYRFDSLAYGIQKLTEEIIKDMIRASIEKYHIHDIALGGGVFMNVKANQHVLALPEVHTLTIIPSCGDESLALGACVYGYAMKHNHTLTRLQKIENLYLGSQYSDEYIKKEIDAYPYSKQCTVTYFDSKKEHTIEHEVAKILAGNSVVGRFKGRAEWGARALGNRSILANASSCDNVKLINEMIKGRDFWMPFATSMLYEDKDMYLIDEKNFFAPYMSITFKTKEKAHRELIAALHPYDLTSRPQMVTACMNKEYHALISAFKNIAGTSGILNTSFNLHGEPNVETPIDALRTFEHSGLPHVAIGNYLISKKV